MVVAGEDAAWAGDVREGAVSPRLFEARSRFLTRAGRAFGMTESVGVAEEAI
jgi:hypothetical protein